MNPESDQEEKAIALYRQYLQQEVERPQVARDKAEFLETHFKPKRRPVTSFLWAPSLAAAAIAAVWLIVGLPTGMHQPVDVTLPQTGPAYVTSTTAEPIQEAMMPVLPGPSVEVKRISSQVGSTMVYQRVYQEIPVTVVWVFPKG